MPLSLKLLLFDRDSLRLRVFVVRTAHNTEINSWPAYVKGVVLWSYRRTRPRAILMSLSRGFLLFVRGLAPLLTALRERRTFLAFLRGAANRRTTFLDFLFLAQITTGSTSGARLSFSNFWRSSRHF